MEALWRWAGEDLLRYACGFMCSLKPMSVMVSGGSPEAMEMVCWMAW